jgi:hypothetical protein
VLLTPNERRVAENRRSGSTPPRLGEPIKDPARLQWTEVAKPAHDHIDTQGLR